MALSTRLLKIWAFEIKKSIYDWLTFFLPIQETVEAVEIVGWPNLIEYYPIKQPFFVTLPETRGDIAKYRLFSQARFIRVYILSSSCANGISLVFFCIRNFNSN